MTENKREKGAFIRCDYCTTICTDPIAFEMKNSTLYCCGRKDCMSYLQSLVPTIEDPCDDCKSAEKTNAIERNGKWYLVCRDCLTNRLTVTFS